MILKTYHKQTKPKIEISGEGEIHFRVITADTGTPRMVSGM